MVGNGRIVGLFLHPVIVVDAGDGDPRQVGHAGGIIGLADANIYSRKKRRLRASARRKRPSAGARARSRPRSPGAGSGVCGRRTSRCGKRRW